MVPDEQVAVLEQLTDLPLDPLLSSGGLLRCLRTRTAARQLGGDAGQILAEFGGGGEDRLGHFFEDMEGAKLMKRRTEDHGDRLGIQRRSIGRDPLEDQASRLQGLVEAAEERLDVLVGRVVVQDPVGEPLEGAVIDARQDAERSVMKFVGCDVTEEVRECPIEMIGIDPQRRLFPPASTQFWIVA